MKALAGQSQTNFDYGAPAGVFTRMRHGRRSAARYRRFGTAAEAIRYAVEELPAPLLPGITMEVGEDTLDHRDILRLYEDPRFPATPKKQRPAAAE